MTRRPSGRAIWQDVRDAARRAEECGAPRPEIGPVGNSGVLALGEPRPHGQLRGGAGG